MNRKSGISHRVKRPTLKAGKKNVSIREIAGKVVDVVKKPFGGKGGRKPKLTPAEQKQAEAKARLAELEKEQVSPEQSYSNIASAFSSFFYTDEKFITQFEDNEILTYVRMSHPEFDPKAGDESRLRKAILSLLDDSKFVSGLMDRYGMTVFDFFKFLFRMEPSVFKGAFITKV